MDTRTFRLDRGHVVGKTSSLRLTRTCALKTVRPSWLLPDFSLPVFASVLAGTLPLAFPVVPPVRRTVRSWLYTRVRPAVALWTGGGGGSGHRARILDLSPNGEEIKEKELRSREEKKIKYQQNRNGNTRTDGENNDDDDTRGDARRSTTTTTAAVDTAHWRR